MLASNILKVYNLPLSFSVSNISQLYNLSLFPCALYHPWEQLWTTSWKSSSRQLRKEMSAKKSESSNFLGNADHSLVNIPHRSVHIFWRVTENESKFQIRNTSKLKTQLTRRTRQDFNIHVRYRLLIPLPNFLPKSTVSFLKNAGILYWYISTSSMFEAMFINCKNICGGFN